MGNHQIYLNDEDEKLIIKKAALLDIPTSEFIKSAAIEKAKEE